jgi:alginate O-acetyltransferase complex protein AlgI
MEEMPQWVLMWLMAAGMFGLAKMAMLSRAGRLKGWRRWGYAFAWPGMDTGEWTRAERMTEACLPWYAGIGAVVLGATLIWGVAGWWEHPLAVGWTGMVGVVLMLHFGVFRMLAGFWQRRGVAVRPLMDAPVCSVTVAEFWGRRWNRAFRDLSQVLMARPLARRYGVSVALWGVFLVSGLAHELVISVPAGGGFGLPTAYFALQAMGVTVEKRFGLCGHVWAVGVIALPAFFLFHPPFVERVILPFLTALGALPCTH